MGKIIELKTVTKIFKSGASKVFALNEVQFSVDRGQYITVVGPSGSGKSTFLHVLGGLEEPTKGSVFSDGIDIYKIGDKKLSFWRNTTVGFVFQFYHLIEELNVFENIAIAAFRSPRKSTFKRVEELLQYLGIEKRRKFYPSQLSGGERQKVAIARALVNHPGILLCDEPTGNLDSQSQEKVVEFLARLNKEQGTTIVLVTHNLKVAAKGKARFALVEGQLVAA